MNDHDDWVLSKESNAKTTSSPFNGNDWQLAAPENRRKDNLLESAIMAPIRIAADTLGGAYNAASKIPEYWQKAKTEVPAFHDPLNAIKHPLHRAGQTLAGALEGAQALNHLPRDIAEYAENRLNLLPQGWAEKVPVAPDITGAIENTFGQPKYPGEALARGAGRNVLNEAALASAVNKIPHLTKSGATKKLRQNKQRMGELKETGILNIKPELIEDMRKYMPNDAAFRDLVDAAHSGDYNKLFKLQSAVGQLSAKRSRALFSPEERIKGQAGFQAINSLLDDMHKEMKGKGLLKESELLRQGRNDFRRYSKFKKYKYGLGALAAGYAVPKNSLTDLGKKIWSIVGQK